MGTVTRNILIVVKETGTTQLGTAMKGAAQQTQVLAKGQSALTGVLGKSRTGAVGLETGITKLDTSEQKAVKTTQNYTKSANTAGTATSGFAAKFQGNKGLIFAFTGIAASGGEAIGMLGMWQDANNKVSEAQERVNMLMNAGVTEGKALTDAESDLTDAKRGLSFATRILALSLGDLVPFALLSINSIIKLKDTIAQGKTAVDAGAAAVSNLGTVTGTAAKGGLAQIGTAATTVGQNLDTFDLSVRNSGVSTDQFGRTTSVIVPELDKMGKSVKQNTDFIGNRGSGLVGGFDALSLGMDRTQKTSSSFSSKFSAIGASIKALPATLTSVGSSIASFFTNFGTHLGKLPGLFKTAGTAVAGFGKALLALALNPIGLAIMGVSAAVLALATDFLGIRTALNQVGAAIGNAIPGLKGLLEWFGNAANGALDAVAGFLGFETQAQKTAKAAEDTKTKMDPLLLSLQKYLDVGQQFQNLNSVIGLFSNLRAEIEKSSTAIGNNLTVIGTAATTLFATFTDKTPQAEMAIKHFWTTLRMLETGQLDASRAGEFLTLATDAVSNAMGGAVSQTQKNIEANQKNTEETSKTQNATLGLSDELVELSTSWQVAAAEGKNMSGGMNENVEAVTKYFQGIGKTIPPVGELNEKQATLLQTLIDNAALLEEHVDIIALNADMTINWDKTIANLTQRHQTFADQTNKDWGRIKALLDQGVEGYKFAVANIEIMTAKDKERGEQAQASLEAEIEKRNEASAGLSAMIDTALEGNAEVTKSEESYIEVLNKKKEEIAKTAGELRIYNQIQNLGLEDQEAAIKITQEQNKENNAARATLQQLAGARGIELKLLGQSNEFLLKYITTHTKGSATVDEVRARLGELVAARQDEIRATDLETKAQTQLLQMMGEVPPILGMTAKGLEQLGQTYDDTANASSIAADEIGLWIAGLEKSQAVEKATLVTLQDYAKQHGIVIPAEIQKDIEKTKEYIEVVTGMGPAAKKAVEEAQQAMEDLAKETNDAINSLIEEDVIEGKAKKVKKQLEELGIAADSMVAHERIFQISANTVDFEDDMLNIQEIAQIGFGGIENLSAQSGDAVIQIYAEHMEEEWGKKFPGIGESLNKLWEEVKASAVPGESASQTIARFVEKLKEGGTAVAAGGKEAIVDTLMETFDLSRQEAELAASGVTTGYASKLEEGAGTVGTAAKTGLNDPIKENTTLIPNESQTALAPLEGVFSEEFKKASIVSTGEINLILSSVSDAMVQMAKNVGTELGKINTEFKQAATNIKGSTDNINSAIEGTQKVASDLSKNIDTYMSSMSSNVSSFANDFGSSMDSVVKDAGSAQSAVEDLQEAIDALKSKTVTITVKYDVQGKPSGLRHGGSFLSMDPTGFARSGKSFINTKPRKIGGVNISEFGKPEVVSVMPLSNPNDPTDKSIMNGMPTSKLSPIPQMTSGINSFGGGGHSGGGQPITVTGNLNVSVMMPDGRVLAKEVNKYSFEGFSGIT